MKSILLELHQIAGDNLFIGMMVVVGLALSLYVIPYTTDVMVNAAAGLAGRFLGNQSRTLIINCSTNNPELITMLLALFFSGKLGIGGISTPLGSNFANIYLMFLVGLIWVLLTFWWRDRSKYTQLVKLIRREWKIVIWHVAMAMSMFILSRIAYSVLPPGFAKGNAKWLLLVAGLCLVGVTFYLWQEKRLRQQRPKLFEDIDDEHHDDSWSKLILGTAGLMFACYLVNSMFLASVQLYEEGLSNILGESVFKAMHYFLGALITSLPELNVAVSNYRKITSADLNTALASASASNMSNLGIAAIGAFVALLTR